MQIQLNNQQTIRLTDLHQSYTYAGLLLGQPSTSLNAQYLEHAQEHAKQVLHHDTIHLIEPQQTLTNLQFLGNIHFIADPLTHAKECQSDTPQQKRQGDTLQRLPLITCYANFISKPLQAEADEDGSQLGLIWYQDEFAMPIAADVIEAIQALEWEQLATSYWH